MSQCPVCKNPATTEANAKHSPFCSPRCKAVDLGKWLSEDYTISEPIGLGDGENKDNTPDSEGVDNGNSHLLH